MKKSQVKVEENLNTRSGDFRYIPCDYVNTAVSQDGIKLILGVEEVGGGATELVGVHMSLKTTNGLKAILQRVVEHAEKELGVSFDDPDVDASDVE